MINDDLQQMLEPLVNRLGCTLWGCEYLAQGKHSLLRIYIDKEEGIGIADCEAVSKQISTLLDVEDPISGNYHLEVSSPGIPRPLFYSWQYARYIGQDVRLKLFKPIDGSRKLTATIVAVNNENVVFGVDGKEIEVPIPQIVKANLIGE